MQMQDTSATRSTRNMPYGSPISAETAKKAAAAALAEARRLNHTVAVAITDPGGVLVYFERMDNTANASSLIALEKSRTASMFRRETAYFDEALMKVPPRLAALAMPGLTPVSGGVPIVSGGTVIGGIGISGGDTSADIACAKSGAAAID
jgi:glc operon protein GlcG